MAVEMKSASKNGGLWGEVVAGAVGSGKTIEEAIDMADIALFHYRARFESDFNVPLPLRESLRVALMFRPDGVGLRVAMTCEGCSHTGTVTEYSGKSSKQPEDMVLVAWDHATHVAGEEPEGDPNEWVPVSVCRVVDLPDPDTVKEIMADAKALAKSA